MKKRSCQKQKKRGKSIKKSEDKKKKMKKRLYENEGRKEGK